MAIITHRDEPNTTLVIGINPEGTAAALREDLTRALALASDYTKETRTWFTPIDMTCAWSPENAQFDPWDEDNVEAWKALLQNEENRTVIAAWLADVTALLKHHQETEYSSLYEHDECQLAEVPASVLAMSDRRYVPIYMDLLDAWDIDHAVMPEHIVPQLIERHGGAPEATELVAFMENNF